jgi:putative CocE/NonD family hydrolase
VGGNLLYDGFIINANVGQKDQTKLVESRNDVLCYTSEPLENSLAAVGNIRCKIFASSSAADTDFTAKLVDVYPDGRAMSVCDGIVRARYRDGKTSVSLMSPGEIYGFDIDLWYTAYVFKRGHSLRL